jgi:hypothetical protein
MIDFYLFFVQNPVVNIACILKTRTNKKLIKLIPSFTSKNDHTEREYIGVAGALTFDCH